MKTLRKTNEYSIQKVKRNFEGSYAIFKNNFKAEMQYNSGTLRYLLKMQDQEFVNYAKSLFYV